MTEYRKIGFLPDGTTGIPSSFMSFRADTLDANGLGEDDVVTSHEQVNDLLGQDLDRFVADYERYVDELVPGSDTEAVRDAMKDKRLGRIRMFMASWHETGNINHLMAALDAKMTLSVGKLCPS